jgi:hypothetical protein
MHGSDADLVVVTDAPEGADQISRLDRQAASGGEHQTGVLPGPAEGLAVIGLLGLAAK